MPTVCKNRPVGGTGSVPRMFPAHQCGNSRAVALTRRPGQVALELPVDLPRKGIDDDKLLCSPEYTRFHAEVGRVRNLRRSRS